MPMLPEERTLMAEQRKIEEHFEMQLDGDKTGKSVRASLPRCLEADIDYGLGLKHLTKRDDGSVVQAVNGKHVQVQFKMDACGSWKSVQQCSIGYTFPRACTNAQSPYDTTEFALWEDDDHWDSVSVHGKGALGEMNALIDSPRVPLPDGGYADMDVCAGGDFSNTGLGDMNCVSS
jgi:hypothetical protein